MSLSGFYVCHFHKPGICGLSIYRVERVRLRLHVFLLCHYRGLCVIVLFQIHIDVYSADLPFSITMDLSFPVTPTILNALHVDWPGNPRQPISNEKKILTIVLANFDQLWVFQQFPLVGLFNSFSLGYYHTLLDLTSCSYTPYPF